MPDGVSPIDVDAVIERLTEAGDLEAAELIRRLDAHRASLWHDLEKLKDQKKQVWR